MLVCTATDSRFLSDWRFQLGAANGDGDGSWYLQMLHKINKNIILTNYVMHELELTCFALACWEQEAMNHCRPHLLLCIHQQIAIEEAVCSNQQLSLAQSDYQRSQYRYSKQNQKQKQTKSTSSHYPLPLQLTVLQHVQWLVAQLFVLHRSSVRIVYSSAKETQFSSICYTNYSFRCPLSCRFHIPNQQRLRHPPLPIDLAQL